MRFVEASPFLVYDLQFFLVDSQGIKNRMAHSYFRYEVAGRIIDLLGF